MEKAVKEDNSLKLIHFAPFTRIVLLFLFHLGGLGFLFFPELLFCCLTIWIMSPTTFLEHPEYFFTTKFTNKTKLYYEVVMLVAISLQLLPHIFSKESYEAGISVIRYFSVGRTKAQRGNEPWNWKKLFSPSRYTTSQMRPMEIKNLYHGLTNW